MTVVWILCRVFAAWVAASILVAAAFHFAKRACQRHHPRLPRPRHWADEVLAIQAQRMPPTPHQQIAQEVTEDGAAWRSFVQAHEWPGSCPDCVWWDPAPSEAEDGVAVYRPCPRHDPVYGPEQEKKAGQ